jgi:DNA-binding response OmpR family regulator
MPGDSAAPCLAIVVDDDLLCRHSMSLLLGSVGLQSLPLPTVIPEVLDALTDPPCLAIIDWNLKSSVGGGECVAMLRLRYPNLSVLVLTGDTSQEAREFIRALGCRYMSKPAKPKAILDEVRKLLGGCPLRPPTPPADHETSTAVGRDFGRCPGPCRAQRQADAAVNCAGEGAPGPIAAFPA